MKRIKIAWIRTDSIGDTVLSMGMVRPVVEDLKKQFDGDIQLTVVCQEHIVPLYQVLPEVDEIIGFNRTELFNSEEYRREIKNVLTQYAFDQLIISLYSPDENTIFFTEHVYAKKKIGLDCDLSNITPEIKLKYLGLLTKVIPTSGHPKCELDRAQDLLDGLNVSEKHPGAFIEIPNEIRSWAKNFIDKKKSQKEKLVILCAGAQYDNRFYYNYGKAIEKLAQNETIILGAIGGAKDYEINQRNLMQVKSAKTVYNWSGDFGLLQSSAIIEQSCLVVCSESAPMHIACALNTPNVVLLGGGHFGRFAPYHSSTIAVSSFRPCYNCNWLCQYNNFPCVQQIPPDALSDAINIIWKQTQSKHPRILSAEQKQSSIKRLKRLVHRKCVFIEKEATDLSRDTFCNGSRFFD
ncbi:glycosyltransferase family 9 protein [uncultured Desulfobacter sp.]|uniref:glycosyltransferase family 9 protein n=1 Tax=uncultured Desulfobacter sp. TaxID=240139 RepID=UPI002AAC41BA|nr:glycosyltransferase family 9 protein [uncultured Desulfobacter sp.]